MLLGGHRSHARVCVSCRCCCDAWQHWRWWQPEQYQVAAASLRDQLTLLRSHPSLLAFMLSSDELPPPDVEAMYVSPFHLCVFVTLSHAPASARYPLTNDPPRKVQQRDA